MRTVKKGTHKAGAKISYTLNVAAKVRFAVERKSTGRKVKHGKKTTCDRATKRNAKRAKCTRYTTLKGAFTRTGRLGGNTFSFSGRLKSKRLVRGSYRLVATPTTSGARSTTISFRVVG